MHRGYVKLHRSIQDNELWCRDPFSRGQAWMDLVMLANHKDGYIRVRGNRLNVKRGQCGWSIKRLAVRWQWSQGKVKRFFKELENDEQIGEQNNTVTTLITITNYEKYQQIGEQTESRQGVDGEQTETNKNGKNEKNGKKKVLAERPDDVSKEIWDDFISQRKTKFTKTALSGFINQAVKAGISTEDAMRESVERGWQSFKAEWYLKNKVASGQLSDEERFRQSGAGKFAMRGAE